VASLVVGEGLGAEAPAYSVERKQIPGGMIERRARTGARYAREKQVLRCAQNDN